VADKRSLVIPEMKRLQRRVFADVAQIHPRKKRERPALFQFGIQAADVSVPVMAAALPPKLFPYANLNN
jgi:hypothetical protein